ncbi:MAG TPA: VWA domain-containing protein [Pyrinomonadaceae bacterium]|nr:VWA domain-containing protein [Pyrinomonadaceae bacterium]
MSFFNYRHRRQLFVVVAGLFMAVTSARGQSVPSQPQQPQGDDVIRVNTELVQTDAMVFDKKGRFVSGLNADQFVLKIDNKPRSIAFFERIAAGSLREIPRPEPDRTAATTYPTLPPAPAPAATGRTVIYFIDDLHLAPTSLVSTRKALLDFIDHGMTEHDQVAITSSSGQIGFLQQFTDDKVALRSAVARLNYRANTKIDMENPPMSEYIALKIREGDEQTITYYAQQVQQQNCFRVGPTLICTVSPQSAREMVKQRAQEIVVNSAPDTDNTLRLFEGLMRSTGQLPGRKLVFFVSDGFYLNDVKTGSRDRIKRITDAAGRAGVVIYTLDARGIIGESLDVTNNRPIDSKGMTASSSIGEISASQDGLNALAVDTGGRAFRNTNAPMAKWINKVLDETANYYLLAWTPDSEEQKRGKFKNISVSIVGRPDLTVRLRQSYFKTAPLPLLTLKKKSEKDPTKAREDDMRLIVDAPVSQRQIPTELTLNLAQMPGVGTRLNATIQINREFLTFELNDGKESADVDIAGIFYNDKGKPINSFVGRLKVFPVPENSSPKNRPVVYGFHEWLPAGLFQVRVGVRDLKSGRVGSAMQWIQIPNLSAH